MRRLSRSAALGLTGALLLVSSIDRTGASEPANVWHDPSPHGVQFVTVDEGVRLEVLDWGGSGRDLVLLAGSGNTAHVFDEFAPKLTRFGHVYGITRRGYGASTAPEDGYSEQRLAEDVLHVIEKLKLKAPVLIGHSMSGEEMTRLGDDHSALLGGLVYLDALEDPKDVPADNPQYTALVKKLPAGIHKTGDITKDDKSSFAALARWYKWRIGVAFPESEFRNMYEANPNGSVGKFRTSDRIYDLIGKGAEGRDYSKISVPILSITNVWHCTQAARPGYACIEHPDRQPDYVPKNGQERANIEAFDKADDAYSLRWSRDLLSAKGGVRLVDIVEANHYLFLSNEDDVLREIGAFVKRLH